MKLLLHICTVLFPMVQLVTEFSKTFSTDITTEEFRRHILHSWLKTLLWMTPQSLCWTDQFYPNLPQPTTYQVWCLLAQKESHILENQATHSADCSEAHLA